MNANEHTVADLVDNLQPTGPPPNITRWGLGWSIAAIVLTAVLMRLVAPYRNGIIDQLAASPRFVFESVLGLIVCGGIALGAFALGIPDIRSHWRRVRVAVVLLAIWLALFVVALFDPVLAPSMAGKRPLCYLEAMLYAVPLAVSGLIVLRRLMPLRPIAAGAWMGCAAGLVPAYLMQFACMHEPWHIISHHLFPIVASVLVSGVIGWLMLRSSAGRSR